MHDTAEVKISYVDKIYHYLIKSVFCIIMLSFSNTHFLFKCWHNALLLKHDHVAWHTPVQCCQNFRVPNSGKLAFLHAANDFYAGFRLTCGLPHCRFDDDICSTAQAPLALAAEGWPSSKQRQANRSITLPLCPPRQIADSWILFNSGAMPLGDKAKAALPLRAATLKQQAMITRHRGKAASGKLVWNQQ